MPTKVFLALSVLLLPVTAQATELYAGFGVGSGIDATTQRSGADDPDETGDPWKLLLGVGVGRYFAVEGAYYDLGGLICCENLADGGFDSKMDGFSVAVAGRLPLGRVTLFGKLGILAWQEDGTAITIAGPVDFSEDGTDLLTGAGLDVRLARGFELRGEWEHYEIDDQSADGVWGSILYRF